MLWGVIPFALLLLKRLLSLKFLCGVGAMLLPDKKHYKDENESEQCSNDCTGFFKRHY